MINIKKYKNIKSINSDFISISFFFKKYMGKYWWFLNSSRLDLAPMGLPLKENLFNSVYKKIFSSLNLLYYLFNKIFSKNYQFDLKNKKIFVFEDVKLSIKLDKKEDYYFKDFPKKTKLSFINIIIGYKKYNDGKNFSLFELLNRKEVFLTLFKCIFVYCKFNILKFVVIQYTINKYFWFNYQKKNNFVNFFLSTLTYKLFKKIDLETNKIIYPYEEKPYERAINYNKKKFEKKNLYAYLINPRDNLALYFSNFKTLQIPRPEKYLFTGKIIANRFLKLKRKNLISYSNSIVGTPKGQFSLSKFKKKNTFLILIGHPSEFDIFFKYLVNKNFKNKINFIFRFPLGVNIKNFKKKLRNNKNFSISINKSLIEDCKISKFSIFSNTSAGIETVNLGLITMWTKTYNINLSPLDNSQNKYFFCSKNISEFYFNIEKLSGLNSFDYRKKHQKQFNITKNICSKLDLYKLKNIIK